jgi:hypothetical protein
MSEGCRPFREQLGPLALGHLPDPEVASVRAHVDGCADCREELRALEEAAGALALVDPELLDEPLAPPRGLGDRIVSLVREERLLEQRRRRRRLTGLLAAAVLAGALAAVTLGIAHDPGVRVLLEPQRGGLEAIPARLVERPWGTEVRLEASGLPAGRYVVWLREPDDDRVPAGSFDAVAEAGEVVLASALAIDGAVGIGVSEADGTTVLYGHLRD